MKIDCPECKKHGQDHYDIVQKCLSSPWYTGLVICGFDRLRSEYHQLINQWFMERYGDGCKNYLIMTSRNHLKTTLFGISAMVWNVIRNPELKTMYMMSNEDEADKKLDSVKEILRNSVHLRHFFPARVLTPNTPGVKVKASYLRMPRSTTSPEGTIEARGATSATTGGHFHWQIFDDLIDEKMVNSDAQQEMAMRKIKLSGPMFMSSADEQIRLIIGTRWPGAFYEWLLSDDFSHYERLVVGAEVDSRYRSLVSMCGKELKQEDGEPVWPEFFTKEFLDDEKRMDPWSYAHQWMNLRASDEDRRFHPRDIMYYQLDEDGRSPLVPLPDGNLLKYNWKSLFRTITIDPSTGEGADESAISVCGYSRSTGNAFVLDDWAQKVDIFELVEKVVSMVKTWEPHIVAPEDVAFQKTLKHFLMQRLKQEKVFIRLEPVKPGNKSKGARIVDSLQPFVRNHQVYFLRSHRDLIDEMLNMQVIKGKVVGKSPNRIDALSYHPQFWRIDTSSQDDILDDDDVPQGKRLPPRYGLVAST